MADGLESRVDTLVEAYFRPNGFERSGRVYEWLGIAYFKKAITGLGGLVRKPRMRPNNYFLWDRSAEGLKQFEEQTRFNEGIHTAAGLFSLGLCATAPAVGIPLVLLNGYCVMLQRYNRARLYKTIERMEARNP